MIAALFFISAGVTLAISSWGILNAPGLFFAVAGIVLSLRKQTGYAAVCGYIPAVGSFISQSMVGICVSCTLAACLFAAAATVSSIGLFKDKPGKVAFGVAILILSMTVFLVRIPDYHVMADTPATPVNSAQKEHKGKILYYFSPGCGHCESTLKMLCENDPEGEYWLPVIVPQIETYGGEKLLRKHGYEGKFETSWESPSGSFPCLVINEQIISGDKNTTEEVKLYFAARKN